MKHYRSIMFTSLLLGFIISGCSHDSMQEQQEVNKNMNEASSHSHEMDKQHQTETKSHSQSSQQKKKDSVTVVSNPTSTDVLVNKYFALPEEYDPKDLVYPDVPFIFNEKIEKRMMRKEAAQALKHLVEGAKQDGIYIAGVSAYRSYQTQKALFEAYVRKDGLEKAKMYSAFPGTSEHETGLAIDVSSSTGKCAAQDCFAGTPEANWLAEHADDYGFIIRYPKGKEAITGYQYEPWHLRYVGTKASQEIAAKGITLEEYLDEVPVSQ